MLAKIRPSLSFANVTSSLALFIALGGTSYAVPPSRDDAYARSARVPRDALTSRRQHLGRFNCCPHHVTLRLVQNLV